MSEENSDSLVKGMKKQNRNVIDIGFELLRKYPKIFYQMYKVSSYNDEPTFFQFNVLFNDKSGEESPEAVATGTSFSELSALRKAFGEMVERYSLSAMDQGVLRKKPYSNRVNMLDPKRFLAFTPSKLNQLNLTEKSYHEAKFSWVKSKNIQTLTDYYLPAQLIYVPYEYRTEEPDLLISNSSGAACGMNLKEALYRGVCELIERDSFLIAYLNKLPCKRIDISSIADNEIKDLVRRISRYNLEIHLIITTQDISVFSICAVILDKTGLGPSVSIGLKAGFDKKEVIVGALEEALMTRSWIRDGVATKTQSANVSTQSIRTIEDRADYWFNKNMISKLNFWLEADNLVNLRLTNFKKDYEARVQKIRKLFKKKGIDCYFLDITSNLFKEYPVCVVKVVSPDLLPMYLDEKYPHFGKRRLQNVSKINKVPHPFL